MLRYLSGTPRLFSHHCVIIVNSVGYGVEVGEGTKQKLVNLETVELFIHTHVREDEITLYGFLSWAELECFELLLNVSGVGPKTALAVVDRGVESVISAIRNADVAFFSSVPRLGKKSAQKIIIELKSKVGSLQDLDLSAETPIQLELQLALQGLGFVQQDIQQALKELPADMQNIESALQYSIKLLGSRRI